MAGTHFLRTRVAGRILTLFFVGAIAPVVLLATLSYRAVSSQLMEQSEARLLQLANATGQIILERLASASSWAASAGDFAIGPAGRSDLTGIARLAPSIEGFAVETAGRFIQVGGDIGTATPLSEADVARVGAGTALLKGVYSSMGSTLFLVLGSGGSGGPLLWTRLVADSLWAPALTLGDDPSVDDLCILGPGSEPLACKRGDESELPGLITSSGRGTQVGGVVRFESAGEPRIAAWRAVYLRSSYGAPDWVVAVSETEASVLRPIASFAYNLVWALALGLSLVLFLANLLVRRTMEPLVALTAGTERIARHDLSARVDVSRPDEFGELASSFNTMADRLSLQFLALEAAQAIDRAVIEESNSTAAVQALVDGIGDLLPAKRSAVLLFESGADVSSMLYGWEGRGSKMVVTEIEANASELGWLDYTRGHVLAEPGTAPPYFAEAGIGAGRGWVLLSPLVVQRTVVGVMAVEAEAGATLGDDDVRRAVQLTDKAAVALNEVRLRRELLEMSWETLRALAIAIDAKSKWTAGHSERVTDLAWAVARRLGLGPEDTETLHRGGLLHDLGKIGVATEILDFSGRLDDEMRRAIEAHPVIGARILEPIRVFQPILPIVRHHHERWDGLGYPDGLSGTDIPYLARILAVADVFDAMISPRPYRDAMPKDVVISHVVEGSGSQFDPDVVVAFEAVMTAGWEYQSLKGGLDDV